MGERLFGYEHEYALRATDPNGRPLEREAVLARLNDLIATLVPTLPAYQYSGLYLANGARLYQDCGVHEEFCTPECGNPWDVCRYIAAGERLLTDAADLLRRRDSRLGEITFHKCNIDYAETGSSWGAHESYLFNGALARLYPQIAPFLASRLVWAGAGGFNPTESLAFSISPRVAYLVRDCSPHSTRDRGLIHTKDEPLAGGSWRRLHVLCGDGLCSQTGNWLKAGVTAVVVAMIEAGLKPGDGVPLKSAVLAARAFAADPTCRAVVSDATGHPWTAIGIQRHYLNMARDSVGRPWMSPWAGEVVQRWGAVLDALASDPQSLCGTLDWCIKLRMFQDHAQRRGVSWVSLPAWNLALGQLKAARAVMPSRPACTSAAVADPAGPYAPVVASLGAHMEREGLNWADLDRVLAVRAQLMELDTRFSELSDKGLFRAMERAGALDHHVHGVDNIEHAMQNPPAVGRARLRGQMIRRLAEQRSTYQCDWASVLDLRTNRIMDMSDPFATEERWRDAPENELEPCPF